MAFFLTRCQYLRLPSLRGTYWCIRHNRPYCKGGRTRADKIGVGAGGDIGGTDMYLYGHAVHGADTTNYREEH